MIKVNTRFECDAPGCTESIEVWIGAEEGPGDGWTTLPGRPTKAYCSDHRDERHAELARRDQAEVDARSGSSLDLEARAERRKNREESRAERKLRALEEN
jgi:hypothetical protein